MASRAYIGITFDILTSYFLFECDLIKFAKNDIQRYILSLDECKQVGAQLKMGSEIVEAALVLFHHQNTFYLRHVLPNFIFIKPQILLDIVNGIVRFIYKVNVGELKGFPAKFVNQFALLQKNAKF